MYRADTQAPKVSLLQWATAGKRQVADRKMRAVLMGCTVQCWARHGFGTKSTQIYYKHHI